MRDLKQWRTSRGRIWKVEALEDRCFLSLTYALAGDVLTITGTSAANAIQIGDFGTTGVGNLIVVGDGVNYTAPKHVREVRVNSAGGNDTIALFVAPVNNLSINSPRTYNIQTGAGNDKVDIATGRLFSDVSFIVRLGGGDDTLAVGTSSVHANLKVDLRGESGNDKMQLLSFGGVSPGSQIVPGGSTLASIKVAMQGGAGNDLIAIATNGGDIRGALTATLDGGPGNDHVYANTINPVNNVNGTAGSVAYSLLGGDGNDEVTCDHQSDLVGTSVVDTLDGGAGNDKCIAVVAGSLYSAAATVRIQGRSGHDTIYFSGAKLLSNSQTDLLVQAGGGNDNVTVNHSPTSQTHSTSRLSMLGEGGNDNLTLNVQSKLIGSPLPGMPAINFNMDGGANNDVVSANLSLLAGSDGPVGHPQQLATVRGGSQNDELHFSIWMVNVMSPIWARVIGDQGKDKAFRDPVILSDPTVEEDYINA